MNNNLDGIIPQNATREYLYTYQKVCRGQMKLKIMQDILMDIHVCELEGFYKTEYLKDLYQMIGTFIQHLGH